MSANPTNPDELEDSRAPFMEHLEELRTRLVRCLLAIFIGGALCWLVKEELYQLITGPINEAQGDLGLKREMIFRTPHGAFVLYLKLAVFGGLFLGIPVILYQVWQFVAPGLYKHEQRVVLPFVFLSTACFAGGTIFCYNLILPEVFTFLLGYGQDFGSPIITLAKHTVVAAGQPNVDVGAAVLKADIAIEDFMGITTRLLLAFGLAFELPVALGFFALVGLITHHSLIKFWRYAVVIAFVVAAILTPPDPYSQAMLAIPLLALYGLSIGLAWMVHKRRSDAEAKAEADADTKAGEG
ncbi:MAG: twin-arginine translocase subunit TatC [Bradymonadia bacterium]